MPLEPQVVDATLQVEQPDTSLAPLAVAAEVASPTGVALPVLDAGARARLDDVLVDLAAILAALVGTLAVAGTVAVSNFPATTEITNDSGNPLPVSGSFYPATQPVSGTVTATATDLDTRDLSLTQDSVRQTQRAMASYVATQAAGAGTVTAADVTAPSRVRLLRLDGGSKPSNPADSFCTVAVTIGTTDVFVKELQVGEPIGGQVCLEGAAGEDLKVTVSGTGSVQFNLRYEIF